jgi:SAM-dependent methyltransferase
MDVNEDPREHVRQLAAEYLERGDQTGWFEALYSEADGNTDIIPWADLEPNKFFKAWAEQRGLKGSGRKALVVGCGLGDDAHYLHELGFKVTAFDISPTAIEWAKKLYGEMDIRFETADLFQHPTHWRAAGNNRDKSGGFDFVLEIYTIQPLPMELREKAIYAVASFVAPGGRLVVVCRGRDDNEEAPQLPWPLSKKDLSGFTRAGLSQRTFDDFVDDEDTRRFVVEYERPRNGE